MISGASRAYPGRAPAPIEARSSVGKGVRPTTHANMIVPLTSTVRPAPLIVALTIAPIASESCCHAAPPTPPTSPARPLSSPPPWVSLASFTRALVSSSWNRVSRNSE